MYDAPSNTPRNGPLLCSWSIVPPARTVPLMALVDVNLRKGASQISRQDRRTSQAITAGIAEGKTKDEARKAVEAVMKQAQFPPGYGWSWGQTFDEDDQAGAQMAQNMLLAIFMITAGIMHFVNPPSYLKIMPPYLPLHKELVLVSGVFEVLLGSKRTRQP